MINIPSYIKDPSYRYQMPALKIKVEGKGNGIRTKLLNLFEVSRSLGVPPEYPLRYFGAEFGAIIEFKQSEQKAMLNGSVRGEDLKNSLDHFIEKFVLCPKCKYPEISIRIKKSELYSDCKACGEFRKMDMTHKICNFILKSPPPGAAKITPAKKPEPVSVKPKSSGKKKSKALTLKNPELIECLEILTSEPELARAGEILTNLAVSKDYEADIKAYLMFKGVFNSNLIAHMSNPIGMQILKNVANGCPEDFLMGFACVYGNDEAWKSKVSTVMFHFYNNDLLTEEVFDNWIKDDLEFNETSPVYNEQALNWVKTNASEFLEWLKNAEEEAEEEEAKEEEAKEKETEEVKIEEIKAEETKIEEKNVESNLKVTENKEFVEESKSIKPEANGKVSEGTKDLMSQLNHVEDFDIDDI